MDQRVAENLISILENEIVQLESERYLCEMKIEDAEEVTNNRDADAHLRSQRQLAENTIAKANRQIAVRLRRLEELRAQVPQARSQQSPGWAHREPDVPTETENAKKMPDMVKD